MMKHIGGDGQLFFYAGGWIHWGSGREPRRIWGVLSHPSKGFVGVWQFK